MTPMIAASLIKLISPACTLLGTSLFGDSKARAKELKEALNVLQEYASIDSNPDVHNPGSGMRGTTAKDGDKLMP